MRNVVKVALSFAIVAAAVPLVPAGAQELVRDAAYEDSFSYIAGLRELSDGRVMISDPLEKTLVILDMTSGTLQRIGREGGGPEEYRQPDAIYALRGDTTLLVDLGNSRFTVVHPDGSFGETKPLTRGQPGSSSFTITLPQSVDRDGNIYFRSRGSMRNMRSLPDSGVVVRMDWQTGAIDTVGTVKLAERRRQSSGGPDNQRVSISAVPLSPSDGWSVGADGRTAFVRSSPYRVDWVEPDGRVTQGAPLDVPTIRVRRPEQEAWLNEPAAGGIQIGISIDNGVASTSMSRGGGSSSGRGAVGDYEWPDVMPPFRGERTRIDPNGNVWVERYVAAGDAPIIDVFGPDGNHMHSITLPEGRRVIGFGAGVVYLTHSDEFDLQYLERYRLET